MAGVPQNSRTRRGFSRRPSQNHDAELLYQRRTRRARSVFQRLALPTAVSISTLYSLVVLMDLGLDPTSK